MSKIIIDTEQILSKSHELRNYKSIHEQNIKNIKNIIDFISIYWSGIAEEAYVEKFLRAEKSMHKFSQILEELASSLEFAAFNFSNTDETLIKFIKF